MSYSFSYTEKHRSDMLADAAKAFADHQITQRSDGRWLLQRQRDGKTSWIYAAEVISLAGGKLYVGGDIAFVIFAYFSDSMDHEEKVRWMGRCKDVGYYVAQKAAIGTGHKLIDEYDGDAARAQVKDWLTEAHECQNDKVASKLEEVLDDYRCPWEYRHELGDYLWSALGSDFMSDRETPGIITSSRVYYAYAALARLCDLLDLERDATQPVGGVQPITVGSQP